MSDEFLYRKPYRLRSLQKVERRGVISERINPTSDQSNLLRAKVEVGVNRSVAAVDEETEFAKSAAVSYHLIDVGVSDRITGALERKVRVMSAERFVNGFAESLRSFVISEVNRFIRAHAFSKRKSLLVSVHGYDVFDTHRS